MGKAYVEVLTAFASHENAVIIGLYRTHLLDDGETTHGYIYTNPSNPMTEIRADDQLIVLRRKASEAEPPSSPRSQWHGMMTVPEGASPFRRGEGAPKAEDAEIEGAPKMSEVQAALPATASPDATLDGALNLESPSIRDLETALDESNAATEAERALSPDSETDPAPPPGLVPEGP